VDDQSLTTKYYWDDRQGKAIYDHTPQQYHTHYVYDLSDSYINYLEYRITSPWKVRAQMGSTISTCFAWGLEYEYANYSGTTMRYPSQYGGTNVDLDIQDVTATNFLPQHTLRAGIEFKPLSSLALRAGYNYITSTTRPDASWDPFFSDNALAYPTALDYMNLSDTHIATFGLGYRYKWFYADLAYKYRHQTGNYYAFNSVYSNLPNIPIISDLTTHTITATLGVRF
jgi:opacity protein-like surface antigen